MKINLLYKIIVVSVQSLSMLFFPLYFYGTETKFAYGRKQQSNSLADILWHYKPLNVRFN